MKTRIRPYISDYNLVRLTALAKRPGMTISAIVDQALTDFFEGDQHGQGGSAVSRRLDTLTRQFDRLERNDLANGETLALFIRYFLTMTPPIAEAQLSAARAQGHSRFDAFVEHLGRELRSGRRLLQAATDDVIADETDFFTSDELARLNNPAPDRPDA